LCMDQSPAFRLGFFAAQKKDLHMTDHCTYLKINMFIGAGFAPRTQTLWPVKSAFSGFLLISSSKQRLYNEAILHSVESNGFPHNPKGGWGVGGTHRSHA